MSSARLWMAWFVSLALGPSANPEPAPLPLLPLTRDECQLLERLSLDQLRDRLGPPPRVSRQILYHRYVEQWTYEEPWRIRVEIDYARGRQPQLLSVQPLGPPKP